MSAVILQTLFYPTTYYKSRTKEAFSELRCCYEKYTHTYISAPDFKQLLLDNGYVCNNNDVFKLRMYKHIHKDYFAGKIGK
jgi:hypothetical protein